MSWLRADWYFTGYRCQKVAKKNGKGWTRVYIYEGEYYGYGSEGEDCGKVKFGYALFGAWILLTYLFAAFSNAAGNKIAYIGVTFLVALLPLLYLMAGLICALLQKKRMTYRGYCVSYKRILRSARIMIGILCIPLLLEGIFLMNNQAFLTRKNEICFFSSMLFCMAGLIFLLLFMKKKRCQIL